MGFPPRLQISSRTRLLGAASLAACLIALLRPVLSGEATLLWMPWNLFLAWIPYVLAVLIRRMAGARAHGTGILVLPTAAWLLFFPNAPYVVTDFVHLHFGSASRVAYDTFLLAWFTVVSLVLGLASLEIVHDVVRARLGTRVGWAFASVVSLLAGVGVWMGRFLRWNSWDVLVQPRQLLATTVEAFLERSGPTGALGFSLAFGLGLLVIYVLAVRLAPRRS